MKRQPFLQQLSREHHHALVLAKRAMRWASEANLDAWQSIRDTFHAEMASHFALEETHLLPMLTGAHDDLVEHTLADHRRLRELVQSGSTAQELHEFGERLRDHVRFEERQLFPALEQYVKEMIEGRVVGGEASPIEKSIGRCHDYVWATLPFLVPMAHKVSASSCSTCCEPAKLAGLLTELHAELLEHMRREEISFKALLARPDERAVRAFAAVTEHEHAGVRSLLVDIQRTLDGDDASSAASCQTELKLLGELGRLISEVRSMMELEDTLLAVYQVQAGGAGATYPSLNVSSARYDLA